VTRVLVAAHSPLVRAGLEAVLGASGTLTVVGTTDLRRPLAERAAATAPDVVLVALGAGDPPPRLEAVPDAAARAPALVVIASVTDAGWVARALAAGARGVLSADPRPEEIIAAVEAAAAGLVTVSADVVAALQAAVAPATAPHHAGTVSLSPRELEVLQLLADGFPNKQVAARLGVSEHTVKTHVTSVFDKLEVSTRAEAVARAVRLGLLVL
jgi:DNA-binding NarL/FixJ family response regulator